MWSELRKRKIARVLLLLRRRRGRGRRGEGEGDIDDNQSHHCNKTILEREQRRIRVFESVLFVAINDTTAICSPYLDLER
jgi:hypothetical protein